MNRKLKILILTSTCIAFSFTLIYLALSEPLTKAQKSCRIFETFCKRIRHQEWAAAQDMLLTEPDWLRVEDGKVLYQGKDVTQLFLSARSDFRRTFQYYVLDYSNEDKAIFQAGTTCYARLNNEKIEFVKIP